MYALSFTQNQFWRLSVKTFSPPPHHNNSLIYLSKYSCGFLYIGSTNQRLDTRIKQRVPTSIRNFDFDPIDIHDNMYGSSIAEHLIYNLDCAKKFSVDLFYILSKSHSSFPLKIQETIHIFSGGAHVVIGYRRRKWRRWHEFKSWTRQIAFHIALIPLGKVWIQLFSLQLWVNSRADCVLQPWWGN